MPVRYDIAAGVPQAQGGGFDPMNAFATMQAMGYRQQQNALAQAQLEEYARARKEEEDYRNLATQPGFDPLSRQSLVQGYQISPTLGMKILAAQEQAKMQQAAAANQASDASIRQQRFQAELPGLVAKSGEAGVAASMATLGRARELAMGVLQSGKGYNDLKKLAKGSGWEGMLGDEPNPQELRALATQASTFQEMLKPHIQQIDKSIVQVEPGVAGQAPVVRPAVVAAPEDAITAPTVYPPGKEPSIGRLVTEGLPGARQPAPVMTQKQYHELPARQEASKIYSTLLDRFEERNKLGAQPSEEKGMWGQFKSVVGGTAGGKEAARITNPKVATINDEISGVIDQYIQMKRASGVQSAQELNTIDELERAKAMLGSGKTNIEAIRRILINADKLTGTGALSSAKSMGGAQSETAQTNLSVTAPNGKTYNFPDQASADAFRKRAGL